MANLPKDDENPTVVLYCHNDGCTVRSVRVEAEFPPTQCPECGSKFQREPVRRESNVRGPRRFNTY